MGQKTHPLGFRIGINERWRSRWNATKKDFPKTLKEDQVIRRYLKKAYFFAGIPMIEIERTGENTTIIVHTARPGILIGKKGKKLEEIQTEVEQLVKDKTRKIRLTISEVNRPELNGQLVAESVREQLEKRQAFRRVMKKTIQTTMNAGADGVKIMLSGRLGGAEMSRCEHSAPGAAAAAGPVGRDQLRLHGGQDASRAHRREVLDLHREVRPQGDASAGIGMRRPVEKPRGEAES